MKSLFVTLLTTLFIFSLFSCSNASEVQVVVEEPITLKSVVTEKEYDVTWTNELEGERLTQNIYADSEHISDYYFLSPENVIVSHKESEPIYPELKGFASLDTRDIPSSIKYIITSFCDSLSKDLGSGTDQYFDANYYFNFVFFKSDLIKNWETLFNEKYPIVEIEEKEEDNITEDEKEKIEQPPLFNKWILGKPFISGNVLQLPIRFYHNKKHLDVILYINIDNNKIFQIVEGPYANTK